MLLRVSSSAATVANLSLPDPKLEVDGDWRLDVAGEVKLVKLAGVGGIPPEEE